MQTIFWKDVLIDHLNASDNNINYMSTTARNLGYQYFIYNGQLIRRSDCSLVEGYCITYDHTVYLEKIYD